MSPTEHMKQLIAFHVPFGHGHRQKRNVDTSRARFPKSVAVDVGCDLDGNALSLGKHAIYADSRLLG